MEKEGHSIMSGNDGEAGNEQEPMALVPEHGLDSSDVSMAIDSHSKAEGSKTLQAAPEPPTGKSGTDSKDATADDISMNEVQCSKEVTETTPTLVDGDGLTKDASANANANAGNESTQTEDNATLSQVAPISDLDQAISNAEAGKEVAEGAAVEFSDLESDSSDSNSDSSSDSDSSSVSPRKRMTSREREEILIKFDEMDEEDGPKEPTIPHTKNEVLIAPVKKPDVEITPDMELQEIGTVSNIVDNVVVVQANVDGDYRVLDSESVLVFPDRTVLGLVFETFGAVKQPMYSVRFNTAEEIDKEIVQIGKSVCHVPQYSHFVFTMALRALKGSDASNRYDEEPAEEEMEFSDDEQEMAHKRRIKAARKNRGSVVPSEVGSSYAPSAAGATDDEGEGYTVLERPTYGHGQIQGQGQGQRDMPPPRSRGSSYHGDSRGGGSYHGDRRGRGGQRTDSHHHERSPQQYYSQQHQQQQYQYQHQQPYPYQQSQAYPQHSYPQQYAQQNYQQQWQGPSGWSQPLHHSAQPPPQQWNQPSYQQYNHGWGYQQAYSSASTRQPQAIDLIQEQLQHLQQLQRQQQNGPSIPTPDSDSSAPPP